MTSPRIVPFAAIFALIWITGATLARAIRWPNDWAEAHWIITYRFGFIKRALAGSLLELAVPPGQMEMGIRYVSAALLAALVAALLCLGARLCARSGWRPVMIFTVAAFFASPYVVMSAHLIGYYDQLLVLLAILACACALRGLPELAALLLVAGVFVHENTLVLGLPVAIFAAILRLSPRQAGAAAPTARRSLALRYALMAAAPLAAFLLLFAYQRYYVDLATLRPVLKDHIHHFPFVERGRHEMVSKAYTTAFAFYYKTQSPYFRERILDLENGVQNGLTLLLLWTALAQGLRGRAFAWLHFIAGVALSLVPLALQLIAWDTERIWAFPAATAFIAAWCAWETREPAPGPRRPQTGAAALVLAVVVFNILIHTLLMDRLAERFTDAARMLLYAPALAALALVLAYHANPAVPAIDPGNSPAAIDPPPS